MLHPTSQVTFLYFDRLEEAANFFSHTLQLEQAFDSEWAKIWRAGADAFVGAVQTDAGSIQVAARGGVLISLTVDDLEAHWQRLSGVGLADLTEIKQVKSMGLRSFFFTGPEGYSFELQQFTDPALRAIFHSDNVNTDNVNEVCL